MEGKRVLLIAGGGAIGSYVSQELLALGFRVDVACLEDHVSEHPNLTYRKLKITDESLTELLKEESFDAIVDFLHYEDPAVYEKRHRLLLENTRHLIFLSSYRVYADEEHPIRETSPQWLDVTRDEKMLAQETYGISKARNERILRASPYRNWTIVRPLISFSHFRFDLVTQGAATLLPRSRQHKKILLPLAAKELTAGLDWAGNVGKIIAHLVLNEKALGEAFTICSGQKHTWGEIANYYEEILGSEFLWIDTKEYLENATTNTYADECMLRYDRLLDRLVDNTKVLTATGLTRADFLPVKEGIRREYTALPETFFEAQSHSSYVLNLNRKIDAYLETRQKD